MTLTLAIETSSINYGIVLSTSREIVVMKTIRHDDTSFRGLGALASSVLSAAGVEFKDVERLAVNIGPGNLGSVRAGVAYANGLAFSLGRSIYCVDSLSLLAAEAVDSPQKDAVLCLRNAGCGSVYAGLFHAGRRIRMGHGPMESVVNSLVRNLSSFSVAGAFRQEVKCLLPEVVVKDTGIDFSTVLTLHRILGEGKVDITEVAPFASPLNDSSSVFNE